MTKGLGRCASQIGCIQVTQQVVQAAPFMAKFWTGRVQQPSRWVIRTKAYFHTKKPFEDLLQNDDRRYLEVQERMLRSQPREADEVVSKPYLDPALKHSPRKAPAIIESSYGSIGYLEFTRITLSDHDGGFLVWKSDRQKIRMIVDARPANGKFCDPPGVALKTADTFAKFEVEGNGDNLPDRFGLFAGLSDVKGCFHCISKHFCFMPIEARHVGLPGHWLEGRQLLSSDLI